MQSGFWAALFFNYFVSVQNNYKKRNSKISLKDAQRIEKFLEFLQNVQSPEGSDGCSSPLDSYPVNDSAIATVDITMETICPGNSAPKNKDGVKREAQLRNRFLLLISSMKQIQFVYYAHIQLRVKAW